MQRQAGPSSGKGPLCTNLCWLATITCLLLNLVIVPVHAADSEQARRYNVLFIAVDDLANIVGSHSSTPSRTPHMDRLSATGVRFDRAYCQIPLCNPSRASVLTGLRPNKTGVFDLDRHFRAQVPDAVTLPQLFRQHGWESIRIGKIFHYDVPKGIGTDGLDDSPSWNTVINPKGRDVTDEPQITNPTPQRPISAALSWLAADGTDDEQTDGMIARDAIKAIKTPRSKPFFLAVGFFRPHTPFVAPKAYFRLFPKDQMQLPFATDNDRDDIPMAALAHNNQQPHYGLDNAICRTALQAYAASVAFVDAQIGRILAALDDANLADETIVVLWSDHGYHLGEHGGIWQKRTLYEPSARSTLIIRKPQATGNGLSCQRVVEFIDIYPTVAQLCGLPCPTSLDGHSLQPLLDNPSAPWQEIAVTQILRPGNGQPIMGRSVRTGRWRYTQWNEGAAGSELFDELNDPNEFHNLSLTPNYTGEIEKLKKLFDQRASGLPLEITFNPARL